MSLTARITALSQAMAGDVKSINAVIGLLSALNTANKTSIVASINEVLALAQNASSSACASISDTTTETGKTWSSSKITDKLVALKAEILGGASSAYDTLLEIEQKLGSDDTALAGLLQAVGNRIAFDQAQSLTTAQKLQACNNLGVGDPETDFLAAYNTAKS
ncbi:hypothetical protein [uncultured Aquitalea sp.]|uniref:hypothetical protein n=1 Tax=uncultured Aquitalea sp. TaxID=540272 RepID=UPI0025DE74A6|nr:hypothetical protein [uncultured Aquitalea sp.]